MSRRQEPQRLGKMLEGFGGRLGLTGAIETGRIWSLWPDIVGRPIADHAEPTSLKDGVLRIRTDSPAWATELGYRGPQIARRANEVAGRNIVSEVRVWTGPGAVGRDRAEPKASAVQRAATPSESPSAGLEKDPVAALGRARLAWAKRRPRGRLEMPEEASPKGTSGPGEKP